MGYFANKITSISSITLFVSFLIGCVLNSSIILADENITVEKIQGVWWTCGSSLTPWAIQFNKDGTFRFATTHLRLEKDPEDVGRFQLDRTLIIFNSSRDCRGPCKGLTGRYKIEFTAYNELYLKLQEDECTERTEICIIPFTKLRR